MSKLRNSTIYTRGVDVCIRVGTLGGQSVVSVASNELSPHTWSSPALTDVMGATVLRLSLRQDTSQHRLWYRTVTNVKLMVVKRTIVSLKSSLFLQPAWLQNVKGVPLLCMEKRKLTYTHFYTTESNRASNLNFLTLLFSKMLSYFPRQNNFVLISILLVSAKVSCL